MLEAAPLLSRDAVLQAAHQPLYDFTMHVRGDDGAKKRKEAKAFVVRLHRPYMEVSRLHFGCMQPGKWLNDEMINLFAALLQQRDQRWRQAAEAAGAQGGVLRCHFFNSFFYDKLFKDEGRYDYATVKRWTAPAKLPTVAQLSPCILDCDLIIVPVHQGAHWTLAVVDLRNRRLLYYDSYKVRGAARNSSMQDPGGGGGGRHAQSPQLFIKFCAFDISSRALRAPIALHTERGCIGVGGVG
ncbi:MAG: Ulp1 family isopeptidase [Cyanobacteriota bacterium]|nr:Ulp1 family isopeptidase [Cyanobacteriota bacterium]